MGGIIIIFFESKYRKNIGERKVIGKLRRLPNTDYKILNDVLIELNGQTHQIDHIVISKYGIFVIETKKYKGIITGTSESYYWYQHLGKNSYKIRNPVHQNYGHIKALCKILNLNENDFISIVSFNSEVQLNIKVNSIVTRNYDDVYNVILEFDEEKNININDIYNKIMNININESEMRKQHICDVKSKSMLTESKISSMICPNCGGKLIVRNGKYGNFVGCSNFPKCRYTQK